MRVARNDEEMRDGYARAKSEAQTAFGSAEIYVEKYIENPKHIEVKFLEIIMEILFTSMSVTVQYNDVIKKSLKLRQPWDFHWTSVTKYVKQQSNFVKMLAMLMLVQLSFLLKMINFISLK